MGALLLLAGIVVVTASKNAGAKGAPKPTNAIVSTPLGQASATQLREILLRWTYAERDARVAYAKYQDEQEHSIAGFASDVGALFNLAGAGPIAGFAQRVTLAIGNLDGAGAPDDAELRSALKQYQQELQKVAQLMFAAGFPQGATKADVTAAYTAAVKASGGVPDQDPNAYLVPEEVKVESRAEARQRAIEALFP